MSPNPNRLPQLETLEDRLAPAVFNVSPLTPDGATQSLRSVIEVANSNSSDDTINLQAGVFELSLAGRDEDAAASGDLDILADGGQTLVIQGAGRDMTFLDANNLDRLFHLRNSGSDPLTVILRNLTLVGGLATDGGPNAGDAAGGAILVEGTGVVRLTLDNVGLGTNTVNAALSSNGNVAQASAGTIGAPNGGEGGNALGGALRSNSSEATISILGASYIGNNQSIAGAGGQGLEASSGDTNGGNGGDGGFAVGGAVSVVDAHLYLQGPGLMVTNNLARGGDGGSGGSGSGSGNGGDGGDGDFARGGALHGVNSTFVLGDVVLSNNTALGGNGGRGGDGFSGGVVDNDGGDGGDGGSMRDGTRSTEGGAVWIDGGYTLTAESVVVTGNRALEGNGGDGGDGDNASATSSAGTGGNGGSTAPNSTRVGGGAFFFGDDGVATISNSTLSNNVARSGNGGAGGLGGFGSFVANAFGGVGGRGGDAGNAGGGGVRILEGSNSTSVTMFNSTTRDNVALGGEGGAGGDTGNSLGADAGIGAAGRDGGNGGDGGSAFGGGFDVSGGGSLTVLFSTVGGNNLATGGRGGSGGAGGAGAPGPAGQDGGLGGDGGRGGDGGDTLGGGVHIGLGRLTTSNSTLSTNQTQGGSGGNGGLGGNGGDGGVGGGTGGNGGGGGGGGQGGGGGGGGFDFEGNFGPGGSSVDIRNSTVASNSALGGTGGQGGGGGNGGANGGGGAGSDGGSGGVGGVTATIAGGGYNRGNDGDDAVIVSSIFADNSAPTAPDYFGPGPFTLPDGTVVPNTPEASNSLIDNSSQSNWPTGNNNILGQDPKLLALQNNGGLTRTHQLASDSPALDKGSNPDGHIVDQRSVAPRVSGTAADIGAVELVTAQPAVERFAVGTDAGVASQVFVYDASGAFLYSLNPFGAFAGGVRVATADVNGDNVEDIIAAAGPGGGPHVLVFDGANPGRVLHSFFAYGVGFTGGVYVSTGDVNGDGTPDIITGAGAGGGPHVRVFDGSNPAEVLKSFFAYSPGFLGGVRVASGNFDGDDLDDIVTTPGVGGGPHVLAFASSDDSILHNFFAYDPGFAAGVYVATGDFNGDGIDDIVTGAGAGGGPQVRIFDGSDSSQVIDSFFAYSPSFTGGVRVAAFDSDGDGDSELITVPGGGGPHLRMFEIDPFGEIDGFFVDVGASGTGLFVG